MPAPQVTVGQLLDRLRGTLQLEEIEPGTGLDRAVGNAEVSSPGIVLAGYVKRFSSERLQVLGEQIHILNNQLTAQMAANERQLQTLNSEVQALGHKYESRLKELEDALHVRR